MMFVKGKDEALLKSIMGVMSETAQQTEEQRKKAAEYLEKTTYAGMRLEEESDIQRNSDRASRDAKEFRDSLTRNRERDNIAGNIAKVARSGKPNAIAQAGQSSSAFQPTQSGNTSNFQGKPEGVKLENPAKSRKRSMGEDIELTQEEIARLDEISKGTLGSYIKKATSSSDERSISNLSSRAADKLNNPIGNDSGEKDDHKSYLRSKGIARAVSRLTKESVEGTTPKNAREKDLAAKAEPKDKITHKDVMVARGIAKEEVELEEAVGDNHLHVQQVKHEGQTKYKVHAVGKNFADGIKVGEHLSDTELDDFSEMGGKIKHVKPAAAKPMKEARTLAAILDEARGRPSKKASEDEDEDDEGPDTGPEADQNIMVHLRKSTDTEGNHDVKFSDGSSHKVPVHVAHKVLGAMEKLKPADRAKIQSHIQQSHANLMAVHKMVS